MIIMASASGTLVPAIARLVAADEDTVRDVIHTFNAKGLAGEASPAVHPLELAQAGGYLAGLGRPARIGRERLRQLLHERGISFRRTRTWKESTDPDRDAKLDRIEYVTSACPDRCFASGQFGPLSIRPCHGVCRAPRKRPVRLRATYHRTHGIRYFHGCCCVGDDQLRGITREHKGADHTLAALKPVRAARPDGYRLFVIMDNLAASKTPAIRRWARRENAGLCFTPANTSRANPIQAQSGPVRTLPWAARTTRITPRWPASCRPASAANASNAGAARNLKPPNRAGARSWPAH
jgi:hypothetical protein